MMFWMVFVTLTYMTWVVVACWCSFVLDETYQLRRRDIWLDEVKETAVESRQGRAFLVRNQPSSASTASRPPHCLLIDGVAVDPVKSVRDLGIYIDSTWPDYEDAR